ncbi:TVP38/TMEM64 family protein [Methylobacterium nodulans]|uniref:SNARE associated Golgi protein n=1 Tax=Methylobacterium nodulans (strain LMG 21967 / CNCM I-2342 / ORS 2060) TaxID=460265 RepID=B8IU34_METNO|nr:VTT domain-containing protein [Methylobacterium nodulans]ACL60892.1 SNARE associated Golgi protein [Methylobacterium nodulans ORS 2060]
MRAQEPGPPADEAGPEAVARPPWRRWLRVLPLVALILISVGLVAGGVTQWFSLDRLLASRAWALAMVEEDRLRAMVLTAFLYVGTVVVSVPVSVFMTMLCGFLFGTVPGALLAISSCTTGAVIVFSIGRTAAGGWLLRNTGGRLNRLAAGFRRDAFSYVLFLRLLPLFPFWMTNLGPAIFGVRLRTFALATLIGISPGGFIYAATGARIEAVVAAHQDAKAACLAAAGTDCDRALSLRSVITPELVATLLALGILALLPVLLRRLRRKPATEPIPCDD